jgi:NADPH:quinone reductase-like Zn-dependent oxidoreductase
VGSVGAPHDGLLGHQRHFGASGSSYFGGPALPYIPGVQGVGRVTGGGPRVRFTTDAGIRPGDGSLAESQAVPTDRMWTIPAGVAAPSRHYDSSAANSAPTNDQSTGEPMEPERADA